MYPCKSALILVIACSVSISHAVGYTNSASAVLDKVVKDCVESKTKFLCFSDKAAVALERSMNWNVPIFEGVNLVRNNEDVKPRTAKALTGFKRLTSAISDFIDTHTVSIDLTQGIGRALDGTDRRGGGGSSGGSGSLFNMDRKSTRREKKYYQYAFMALLGIFALTGPLVMKVLAVIAAKALFAAKAALIIVGGVALRNIFENSAPQPKIKVHTIPYESEEHEYDRMGNAFNYNYIPYNRAYTFTSPGSYPYSAYANNNDFAPIFYGTQKKSR